MTMCPVEVMGKLLAGAVVEIAGKTE